jgi:hypothetical protein
MVAQVRLKDQVDRIGERRARLGGWNLGPPRSERRLRKTKTDFRRPDQALLNPSPQKRDLSCG